VFKTLKAAKKVCFPAASGRASPKEELIQYAAGFELSPQEIVAVLKESKVDFAGDE